ncbi:TolC family protein [Odoribacter lunatus]|uniref:TolC family protein n=1 Tax=Odoribacter lunatus TaxID=2941335 RepID=UPI00203BAE98|nr:TolC family protein [Odoribacter lunatus]
MKKIILIGGLLYCIGGVNAQVILNLPQCREMALENSKQTAIARKQLEKAESEKKAYHAGYFPRLSITGMGFYNQEKYSYKLKGGYLPTYVPDENGTLQPNIVVNPSTGLPVEGADGKPVFKEYAFLPDIGIKVGMRGVYTVGVQLQQPVYMGGKVRTAHEMSKIGETMANENIRLSRSEVFAETDKAYWQLLGVEEQVKAAEAYRQALGELLKNVENARKVGMITGNDVLKVQVRYNEADLLVQKARNGLVLSQMNLCRIIGLDLQTDIAIQDSLSETILPGILTQSAKLTQRPDYNLLQEETVLKEKEIHLVQADFLPQIGVTAGYGYGGGLELNGERESKASFNALAYVEIPLFNWGEGRNKSKAARTEHEISRLNLEKSAQLMELEITSARFNIQDAQTRIKMAKNALLQAEENLRISNNQYKVGMESLTNLLEAQAQWQEAQSQWVEAKAALKMSETQYLKAIGRLAE